MQALLADVNITIAIVSGLRDRYPEVLISRAQELGFDRTPDPELLDWAAANDRIVVTHDVSTMRRYADDRVRTGSPMPGLIIVRDNPDAIGQVVEDLATIALAMHPGELEGRVVFLPLR